MHSMTRSQIWFLKNFGYSALGLRTRAWPLTHHCRRAKSAKRCAFVSIRLCSMGSRDHAPAGFDQGLVSEHNFGPLAVDVELAQVRVDGSWHRSYWIAEWPRLELHPAWMESLLLHAGGVRTIAMVYEPVPPSRSQRQIDRDATRLASDEEQRAKRGFRIGARHRRAEAAVLERESELVAGYAELEFRGLHERDRIRARAPRDRLRGVRTGRGAGRFGIALPRWTTRRGSRRLSARRPLSDAAPVRMTSTSMPVRRLQVPRHRATTAHLCSAYPFLGEAGLEQRGIYIGTNVLTGGGSFAYDPFTAYADGLLTNPNVIVAGEVGMGKSTAIKTFVYRSVGTFGRWVAIVDPKGEYGPLADALGLRGAQVAPGRADPDQSARSWACGGGRLAGRVGTSPERVAGCASRAGSAKGSATH